MEPSENKDQSQRVAIPVNEKYKGHKVRLLPQKDSTSNKKKYMVVDTVFEVEKEYEVIDPIG